MFDRPRKAGCCNRLRRRKLPFCASPPLVAHLRLIGMFTESECLGGRLASHRPHLTPSHPLGGGVWLGELVRSPNTVSTQTPPFFPTGGCPTAFPARSGYGRGMTAPHPPCGMGLPPRKEARAPDSTPQLPGVVAPSSPPSKVNANLANAPACPPILTYQVAQRRRTCATSTHTLTLNTTPSVLRRI